MAQRCKARLFSYNVQEQVKAEPVAISKRQLFHLDCVCVNRLLQGRIEEGVSTR